MTTSTLAGHASTYLAALKADVRHRAETDAHLAPFIEALDSIDIDQTTRGPYPPLEHDAMKYLAKARRNANCDSELGRFAIEVAGVLDWSQLYGGGGMDEKLAEGMLEAQVAGAYGCFPSDTVATGQLLLAPNTYYPLHTHAAVELYYSVSGTLSLQHGLDGEPFEIAAGEYSITPSNRLHALWTNDEPVLLLYVWIGQVSEPVWVWTEDDEGQWTRSRWKLPPGKPWEIDVTEPISQDKMDAAHEQ